MIGDSCRALICLGLLCLAGTAAAMSSTNYDLSWNVIGGGGGAATSASYGMQGTVGQVAGTATSSSYTLSAGYWYPQTTVPAVVPLPGCANPPQDLDHDGLYEDVNGDGVFSFGDIRLFFEYYDVWIPANEPVECFDYDGNSVIGFGDVRALFWMWGT